MRKSRIIGHLQELDSIRRDEYMPQEVVDKVIELEKVLTLYLTKELEHPTPDDLKTSPSRSNNSTNLPLNGV